MRNVISRRGFIRNSALAGISVNLMGTNELRAEPETALPGRAAKMDEALPAKRPALLSEIDRFNYAVGTQTINGAYQFTGKARLIETAEAIREMGCSVIKLSLAWAKDRGRRPEHLQTLSDLASKDAVMRDILNLPFGQYVLWAYPIGTGRGQSSKQADRDEELYELSCHLLKTYSGTGKVFYLGHWEGDWELRGKAGGQEDPTPEAVTRKIRWLNLRQKAVDDAKRDTPHQDVDVFCYAEANLVQDAMNGRRTMVNDVIPQTSIDYVSYSSYDTTNDHTPELAKALDYIESKLRPKPGLKGKRVWVGEYGYPAERFSPQEQDARSRQVIRAALQWGCPFVLYWELYNNEVDKNGKQRGFWLIDDKGVKQPAYYTHQQVCKWGRQYVADAVKSGERPPSFEEYRKAAVAFLDNLPPAK